MLQIQFFLQNAHFALNMFAALVMFAVAWLYFDAWLINRKLTNALLVAGYFLLSISFLFHAITVEVTILEGFTIGTLSIDVVSMVVQAIGFIMVIIGVLMDPLQEKPHYSQQATPKTAAVLIPGFISITELSAYFLPSLCLGVAIVYLRRATTGMEKHVRTVSIAFFVLTVSEIVSSGHIFRQSNNVFIYNLLAPFGTLWIIEHLMLLIGICIFFKWILQYLLERLQTQLCLLITALVIGIFLIPTVS